MLGFQIAHLRRFDENPDFASGLNGVSFFNARERIGDIFQIAQAPQVIFNAVAARARPRAGNGVGGLDDDGFQCFVRILAVMRLHRLDYFLIHAEFFQNPLADVHMSAGDFMINRFADVVQQRAGARHLRIGPQFLCDHSGQMGHFHRMLKHILTVTGAKIQPSQNHNDAWIQIKHIGLVSRLLTFFFDDFGNIFFGLDHHLLNFCRMNPAVQNQIFQRHFGDLSANRIKRRQRDRAGRIVNNHFHAGGFFKGPDIAAFLADNFTFDIIGGDFHHRRGDFRDR